jgi:GGDEF domain-containing protein
MYESITKQIDEIYTSLNIYKALFVCLSQDIDGFSKYLKQKDYPVCGVEELDKFNNNEYRIMIIDYDTFKHYNDALDFSTIDTVINISVFEKVTANNNIKNYFFI